MGRSECSQRLQLPCTDLPQGVGPVGVAWQLIHERVLELESLQHRAVVTARTETLTSLEVNSTEQRGSFSPDTTSRLAPTTASAGSATLCACKRARAAARPPSRARARARGHISLSRRPGALVDGAPHPHARCMGPPPTGGGLRAGRGKRRRGRGVGGVGGAQWCPGARPGGGCLAYGARQKKGNRAPRGKLAPGGSSRWEYSAVLFVLYTKLCKPFFLHFSGQ